MTHSFNKQLRNRGFNVSQIYILEICDRHQPRSASPVAWLLIERQENYKTDEPEGAVYEASIRLQYERIDNNSSHTTHKGEFTAGYFRDFCDTPYVSLTSESSYSGAVFLDLPGLEGQRIGTYLMNEIVEWSLQWPAAKVYPIELRSVQAYGENKKRRNRFYEQFGLTFDYFAPSLSAGRSKAMNVSELTPVEVWMENITEQDLREFAVNVLNRRDHLKLNAYRYEASSNHCFRCYNNSESRNLLLISTLQVIALILAVLGISIWAVI